MGQGPSTWMSAVKPSTPPCSDHTESSRSVRSKPPRTRPVAFPRGRAAGLRWSRSPTRLLRPEGATGPPAAVRRARTPAGFSVTRTSPLPVAGSCFPPAPISSCRSGFAAVTSNSTPVAVRRRSSQRARAPRVAAVTGCRPVPQRATSRTAAPSLVSMSASTAMSRASRSRSGSPKRPPALVTWITDTGPPGAGGIASEIAGVSPSMRNVSPPLSSAIANGTGCDLRPRGVRRRRRSRPRERAPWARARLPIRRPHRR